MRGLFFILIFAMYAATGVGAEPPRQLLKANALPLALDDRIQFRKAQFFLNEPKSFKPTTSQPLAFKRQQINFKAVTEVDRKERRGNYFTFFWRAQRRGDLTMRLEYRQENLGPYVQAREVAYRNVKGSMKTKFAVIGDDYHDDGRVTAWRAVLIEDGRIVALTQSFLWN